MKTIYDLRRGSNSISNLYSQGKNLSDYTDRDYSILYVGTEKLNIGNSNQSIGVRKVLSYFRTMVGSTDIFVGNDKIQIGASSVPITN